ncbi:MAG: 4-hydroxy-tetrahydrodipicolinate synthase [Alphaproteobacteria bacterium]|nr:4-hydroxy-tetrahydrodipicolinate synthase [Alphaproteobacteria bacterium]
MPKLVLQGVHTALVTPFNGERVDEDGALALARRQLRHGVTGLVPCGTTGETPTLDEGEWAAVISAAVQAAREADRFVPVTAGCGTNSTRSTCRNIEQAAKLGADAALVVLPYYNKPNPDGHRAHMREACAVGLPVVVYHVPGRTGQRLPVELLAELCDLDGVVAVKEATGDVRYGSDLVASTRAAVLSGDDFTWFPLTCVGGQGVISVISNVDPARCVALDAAARGGDLETARALHHALMPVNRYLFAEVNPVPVKAAMSALGLCANTLRLPLAATTRLPPEGLLDGVAV